MSAAPAADDPLCALPPDAVLAVGAFDGLHLGHQTLIADTLALARAESRPPAILTFTGSPRALLDPLHAPGALFDRRAAQARLHDLAPDATLIFQPFTPAFAAIPAEVWDEVRRGVSLTDAYSAHLSRREAAERDAELSRLRSELERERRERENARRSAGSAVSVGGDPPYDPISAGWNSI